MKTRKKQGIVIERIISMLLIFSIVLGFPAWEVRAEEKTDITSANYTQDEAGEYIYVANVADATYGSITVPTGYHFVIEQAISADSITLEAGAFLEIWDIPNEDGTASEGRLTCSNIQAADTAKLLFTSKANLPSGVGIHMPDGQTVVDVNTADENMPENYPFWNVEAEYKNNQWNYKSGGFDYVPFWEEDQFKVRVESLDAGMKLYIQYSTNGNTWINAPIVGEEGEASVPSAGYIEIQQGEGDWQNHEEIVKIPDTVSANTIYLKIRVADPAGTTSNKIIHGYDLMPGYVDLKHDPKQEVILEFENYKDEGCSHDLVIFLGYVNAGNKEIVNKVNEYLYAYSFIQSPQAGGAPNDLKRMLAYELYSRFINVPMFESFGLPTHTAGNSSNATDAANSSAVTMDTAVQALKDRITLSIDNSQNETSVNVYSDNNGGTKSITMCTATINWGYDIESGEPVVSTINVYYGLNKGDVLIAPNFENASNTGTLYIRNMADTVRAGDTNFDGFDDRDKGIILILDSWSDNVVCSGNFGETNLMNDEGCYSINYRVDEGFANEFSLNYTATNAAGAGGPLNAQWATPVPLDAMIRIISPNKKYVLLSGSGEPNEVDSMGFNGAPTDVLWNVDTNRRARVYVGDTEFDLIPMGSESGMQNANITSVSLADSAMADGVKIIAPDDNNGFYGIKFESNYYSEVPISITYEDGTTANLIIERIGLVIQYRYLGGEEGEDTGWTNDRIEIGCTQSEVQFRYHYWVGEQIVVWATYYHPTTDNTGATSDAICLMLTDKDGKQTFLSPNDATYIVNNSAYQGVQNCGVATTTFILGFAEGKTWNSEGNCWEDDITSTTFDKGPLYITVVNEGYDDPDSFAGAQIGSGKGVYWDGKIQWGF